MATQQTLTDQQQHSSVANSDTDVIFTVNGSKKASRWVYWTGTNIGYESLNSRPPEDIEVDFVDWPFSKLEDYSDVAALFEKHLNVVQGEKPQLAVAPDIDDTVSYGQALEWAKELENHCETVIIAPKTVPPSRVPSRFRVGMPCQERYGAPWWQFSEYQEAESVHLLGGSPVTHRKVMKHFIPVESIDTAVPVKCAKWGSYWNGEKWQDSNRGFYKALQKSYTEIRKMVNKDPHLPSIRCQKRAYEYREDYRENHPDADLWGPDEIPIHGRAAFGVQ